MNIPDWLIGAAGAAAGGVGTIVLASFSFAGRRAATLAAREATLFHAHRDLLAATQQRVATLERRLAEEAERYEMRLLALEERINYQDLEIISLRQQLGHTDA